MHYSLHADDVQHLEHVRSKSHGQTKEKSKVLGHFDGMTKTIGIEECE